MPAAGQVVLICFFYFACKNYNTRAAMLVASQAGCMYLFLLFYL